MAALGALLLALAGAQIVFATAPSASFDVSPSTTLSRNQEGTFTSTTPNPDADGDTIDSVQWDFESDGTFDASGASVQHAYTTTGTRTVRMRATDSAGEFADATKSITVPNIAPTASFTVSPANANIGQTVTFNASASNDPGGSIVKYEWDLDGDDVYETDTGTTASVTRSYSAPATLSVQLRVTDNAGVPGFTSRLLTIVNRPPVARIDPDPDRAQIGNPVTFKGGTSSDPDPGDSITSYEWDFGTGSFGSPSASPDATTSFSSGGDKNVRLRVTDKFGGTNVAPLVYHVNAKPLAKIAFAAANPEPGQNAQLPIIGQQVGFASTSTDAEATNPPLNNNTIEKWEWFDANPPGGPDPSGAFGPQPGQSSVLHAPYTTAGEKRVFLRVTDNEGAVSEATPESVATVRVNTRPVAKFALTPETPLTGKPVTFSDASTDDDDPGLMNPSNGLVTKWEWDLDGNPNTGTDGFEASGKNVTTTYATPGKRNVRLRVTDGGGARSVPLTKSVMVADTLPNAQFGYSPKFPLPGQQVSFNSTSTPSAGKSIQSQEWDLDYDEVAQKFDVDASGPNVTHTYATAGEKLVAIRVTESGGGVAIEKVRLIVNAPPSASFNASPSAPFTGDVMTFTSTSSDPDGPLTLAWDTDNDGQFDDATGAVATRTFTEVGAHTIRLRATDDRGASAITSGIVNVAKRPLPPLIGARVQIAGRTTDEGARLSLLRVRGPAGMLVQLKCKGDDCPRRSKRVRSKNGTVRFKRFEREFGAGSKLIVKATIEGFTGKRVGFKIRKGKSPRRTDRCLDAVTGMRGACP